VRSGKSENVEERVKSIESRVQKGRKEEVGPGKMQFALRIEAKSPECSVA